MSSDAPAAGEPRPTILIVSSQAGSVDQGRSVSQNCSVSTEGGFNGKIFRQKNIERYRRMLANPRDEDQRRIILKLLADEEAELKEHAPETE